MRPAECPRSPPLKMFAPNYLRVCLAAFAVTPLYAKPSLPVILHGGQNGRAMEFLLKSWQNKFPDNVNAIINQRDPRSESGMRQIHVLRSKDGKQRAKVLEPLRFQGIETIDDGVRNRTYFPDDHEIIDDESLSKVDTDFRERLELAKKNYTFDISAHARIAGRATLCVTATPKYSEMDLRKFYLDAANSYPLRAETVSANGEVTVIFETKVIRYKDKFDSDTFKFQDFPNVRLIKYTRPKTYSRAQIGAQVGFSPYVPETLPYGFRVQEIQYSKGTASSPWSPVRIRIYDGLARATVYQWIPRGENLRTGDNSTSKTVAGVKIMIVSDLGPRIRQRLLDAFAESGHGNEARSSLVRNEIEKELTRVPATFIKLEPPFGIRLQPIGLVADPLAPQ